MINIYLSVYLLFILQSFILLQNLSFIKIYFIIEIYFKEIFNFIQINDRIIENERLFYLNNLKNQYLNKSIIICWLITKLQWLNKWKSSKEWIKNSIWVGNLPTQTVKNAMESLSPIPAISHNIIVPNVTKFLTSHKNNKKQSRNKTLPIPLISKDKKMKTTLMKSSPHQEFFLKRSLPLKLHLRFNRNKIWISILIKGNNKDQMRFLKN